MTDSNNDNGGDDRNSEAGVNGFDEELNLSDSSPENSEDPAENLQARPLNAQGFDNEQIDQLRREVEDNKDKYLRALADMENFRKRSIKERSDLLKYQGDKIFLDILEVVDNLELAIAHGDSDPAKFKAGVELIHKRFIDILNKWEVKGESAIGQAFDSARHDAISKVSVDDAPPGTVINELKKAYFYKDKLLRPAEVVVVADRGNADNTASDSGEEASDEEAEGENSEETAG